MLHLNMLSNNFSHAHCSTWWKVPNKIKWDFGSNENNLSVYIDSDMHKGFSDKNDGKKKFLWLLESRQFDGGTSEQVLNHLDQILETYEQVWTHSDTLIKSHPIFKWSPAYGTIVDNSRLYEKSKKISMITSDKQWSNQQKFRYGFALENKEKLDLFGRGFNNIENKEDGLKDYMFSVSVENDTYDTYFTEKILDCFATGTIPIYKGTKKIIEHFNSEGIIFLDEINIDSIDSDLYFSKIEAIKENLEIVKKYEILDDWIYDNYLINYV